MKSIWIILIHYWFLQMQTGPDVDLSVLDFLLGEWQVEVEQSTPSGQNFTESGTARVTRILQNDYLQIEVEVCRNNRCRSYLQLVTCHNPTETFHSTYYYSGTHLTVTESGKWNEDTGQFTTSGVNPWASEREDGINIITTYWSENDDIWHMEVNELRRGEWSIGYRATFTSKT